MSENIFEQATKMQVRFTTRRGVLSVEDLWHIKVSFLDEIYADLSRQKEATQRHSLIEKKSDESAKIDLKLSLVEHVFAARKEAAEKATAKADRAAKKQKLLAILSKKQDQQYEEMSAEELQQIIEEM